MFLDPRHFLVLCEFLSYQFKNPILLAQAITRESALRHGKQQNHIGHNATLATDGDALLRVVIQDILRDLDPKISKGQMSQQRDKYVNNEQLSRIANKNNLWQYLIMADHEQKIKNRGKKVKIVSDALEAIIAAVFIDSNKNIQSIKKVIIKLWGFIDNYNELFIAALQIQDLDKIGLYLNCGADPNIIFIDHLYRVNSTAEEDNTPVKFPNFPLRLAVSFENPNLVSLLLDAGAVPDFTMTIHLNMTPLYDAACIGNVRIAQLLLEAGATYTQEFGTGYTPLHVAAFYGKTEMVNFLLDNKAEVNKLDFYGTSPLHAAATKGKTNTVACLLKSGADVNVRSINDENNIDCTPLHCAAGCLEGDAVIQLLLEYGADLNARNHNRQTALHIAVACHNIGVIRELLKHKPDQSIFDNNGKCAKDLTEDPELLNLLKGRTKLLLETPIIKDFGSSQHILLKNTNTSNDQQANKSNIELLQDEKYCVLI